MKEKLHSYRKTYKKHELLEEETGKDPFELFRTWLREVEATREVEEVNTMTVSTIGPDGYPKARIVLLKEFDDQGFVFYTNYNSEKGKAIEVNPKVCLSFFWPGSERQVIIKGIAKKISEEESTLYFHSRPRGSQLGAWASEQSRIIPSQGFLEDRLKSLEEEYQNITIPKPPHWGGYKVHPVDFEFWQGRPNRLHDRILFSRENDLNWKLNRLAP